MAKMAICGLLAIRTHAQNIGIPEKTYKNVAQQCQIDHCNKHLTDVIDKTDFLYLNLLLCGERKRGEYLPIE